MPKGCCGVVLSVGPPTIAQPRREDVDVGVNLQAALMRASDHIGQRIEAGIGAQRFGGRSGEPRGPRFQRRGVIGIGGAADLKEQRVEVRRGGVVHNRIEVGSGHGVAEARPIEARDPQPAKFFDDRIVAIDQRQVGRVRRRSP